jgi:hypothetical protein
MKCLKRKLKNLWSLICMLIVLLVWTSKVALANARAWVVVGLKCSTNKNMVSLISHYLPLYDHKKLLHNYRKCFCIHNIIYASNLIRNMKVAGKWLSYMLNHPCKWYLIRKHWTIYSSYIMYFFLVCDISYHL